MPEYELPWPPARPPTTKAVKKAWISLHTETIAYLKRHIPVVQHETRALLKILRPRELNVRIVTEEEHANGVVADTVDDDETDCRPLFDLNEEDEPTYDSEDTDQGDLATTGTDLYRSDTRFCIALSLRWKETTLIGDALPITKYEYQRLSVHPETAGYLISRLRQHHRKTIADALIFQLIRDDGEQLAEEEWDDGGVAPEWRNMHNDPAMDALLICEDLRRLYRDIVGEHDEPSPR